MDNVNVTTASSRLDLRRMAVVAVGDLLVFVGFVILGSTEHGIIQTEAFVRTALPFAATWFAVSPWLGAYQFSTLTSVRSSAWRIPLAWLACGIIAVLLRAWLTDRTFQLSFALVAIGVQAVLLLGWRVAFAVAGRRLVGSW